MSYKYKISILVVVVAAGGVVVTGLVAPVVECCSDVVRVVEETEIEVVVVSSVVVGDGVTDVVGPTVVTTKVVYSDTCLDDIYTTRNIQYDINLHM